HGQMAPGFEHSLTVQASVISRQSDKVIVDAGNKSVAAPADVTMVGHPLAPFRFDEEHGIFAAPQGSPLRVGDSVALVPGYSPTPRHHTRTWPRSSAASICRANGQAS